MNQSKLFSTRAKNSHEVKLDEDRLLEQSEKFISNLSKNLNFDDVKHLELRAHTKDALIASEYSSGTLEEDIILFFEIFDGFKTIEIKRFDEFNNLDLPCLIAQSNSKEHHIIYFNDKDLESFHMAFCLKYFIEHYPKKKNVEDKDPKWDEYLKSLNIPMVLMDEFGNLLVHNQDFINLGIAPKTCIEFKNDQAFETKDKTYIVLKKKIPDASEKFILLFVENKSCSGKGPDQELGIITSSMAHELINPIGGILIALGLLGYSDDLSDEDKQTLEEMRKSATRCKDLVQNFLGFSKMALPNRDSWEIRKAYEQSLNLLRYRLIETNTKFDLEFYDYSNNKQRPLNTSIFSMVFYLIYGELLTKLQYQNLIEEKQESHNYIKGRLENHEHVISLIFEEAPLLSEDIFKSQGLIKNLLDFENVQIKLGKKQVNFSL